MILLAEEFYGNQNLTALQTFQNYNHIKYDVSDIELYLGLRYFWI